MKPWQTILVWLVAAYLAATAALVTTSLIVINLTSECQPTEINTEEP